jgi:MoaA/NifB/PqqE/SkfB family radical SAM enzyme
MTVAIDSAARREWALEAAGLLARLAERPEIATVDALTTLARDWLLADAAGVPDSHALVRVAARLGERYAGARIVHIGRDAGVGSALGVAGAAVWSYLDHPARVLDALCRHRVPGVRFAVLAPGAAELPETVDLVVIETFDGAPVVPPGPLVGALEVGGRLAILGAAPAIESTVLPADGGIAIGPSDAVEERAPSPGEAGAALYRLDLLTSGRTEIAHLEFTSRCNLRCVYCAVSQPTYVGTDLDFGLLDGAIAALRRRRLDAVVVNGHGETTMVKGWEAYCDALLDAGLALQMTTNFARELTAAEAATLARFRSVEVSCDTVDPALFKALRRSADFRTLLLNMAKVRAAALERGVEGPTFAWSCVVSDRNVLDLPHYAAFGLASGVKAFNFCSLTEYPTVPGALAVRHIARLPAGERDAARMALTAAVNLLRARGAGYFCQAGLLYDGDETAEGDGGILRLDGTVAGRRFAAAVQAGATRDCLDPWKFTMVKSNGDVLPCCWRAPIGSLGDAPSLDALLESEVMRSLRQRLLSGDLDENCRTCPARSWTGTAALARTVTRYLAADLD